MSAKQVINDKSQGSVATYLRCGGVVYNQWCIAKNGGGYTQRGVAKGLKVHCLFMITEVSIRCQKNPEVGIRRIPAYTPPQYTTVYNQIKQGLLLSLRMKQFLKSGNVSASTTGRRCF